MNLSNGRPAWVRPFGKDVRNICPKNLMVKQFKSIFSGFDILPKRLKQARSLPLVSVSFSRRDVPVSLFFFLEETVLKKRSRKNCTVRPQLHQIVSTPHVLLSFVASKRENLGFEAFWNTSKHEKLGFEVFRNTPKRENPRFEVFWSCRCEEYVSRLKIFTGRFTSQPTPPFFILE